MRIAMFGLMLAALSGPALAQGDNSALPPGPGRDVTIKVCSQCHSVDVVVSQRLDPAGWKDLVNQMANNGANASDADFDTITKYLAASFPATPAAAAPAAH